MKYKYFAYPDFSYGHNLNKIKVNIELISNNDNDIKMNLERFEALKHFNDPHLELFRDKEFLEMIEDYKKEIKKNISIYFNNEVHIEKEIKILFENSPDYIPTFLQVISQYKLDNKANNFEELLLDLPNRHISSILQNKYLVNKYPQTITEKLLSYPKNTELLINILVLNSDLSNYTLPDKKYLSTKQINNLFLQYIQSKSPNPNYLTSLYQEKYSFQIDTRVRSMAKDTYDDYIQNMFSRNKFSGITTDIGVKITPLKEEIVDFDNVFEKERFSTTIKINEDWLIKSLDFNSILQNLIYVFQLVDRRFRFSAIPSKESEGVFERSFRRHDKNTYFTSSVFKMYENQYLLMFRAYEIFLKQQELNILEVVKWYLNVYLKDEYGIKNFNLEFLDNSIPKNILNNELHTQFQRLIKMYHLYSIYEEINLKEVDIETHKTFGELEGINGIKYIYLEDSKLHTCSHYLFSDQSLLGILEDDNKFYIGLEKGKIKAIDIEEHLVPYIELLKEKDLIKVENGLLIISSYKYYILKELFFKNSINYYWTTINEQKIIAKMIEDNELSTSNSLLSKEEIDYFNYYLNDYFSNGLALRNKYSHGSTGEFSEEEHENNYTLLSYLIVLFIIKINEEFNYRFDFSKSNKLNNGGKI